VDRSHIRTRHLHPLAAVAFVVASTGLLLIQRSEIGFGLSHGSAGIHYDVTLHGWPCAMTTRLEFTHMFAPSNTEVEYIWKIRGIATNILVCLSILFSIVYVVEKLTRLRRLQWRLSTCLAFVLVICVTLAIVAYASGALRINGATFFGLHKSEMEERWFDVFPWYIQLPIVFGVGCTVYSVFNFTTAAGRWLLASKRPV